MEYKKVKNFCWNKYSLDENLSEKFKKDDGYILLLELIRTLNEYANEIDCIISTIDVLESWKNEKFFNKKETTYEIDWFGTHRREPESVNLSEAKKIYREIRTKYDTLVELFEEASLTHYNDKESLTNKYFSFGL